MKKKAALHNLGCKVNAYETEAMRQLLEEAGYEIMDFVPGADVYVINTCTVTNIADRKSRQMLHKARKMNPDAIVVATGCYAQTAEGEIEKDPAIDIVLGNNRKGNLLEVLAEFSSHGEYRQNTVDSNRYEEQEIVSEDMEERKQPAPETIARMVDINHTKEYEKLSIDRTEARTRADIKIQDGCNQFCTYCIIPFARGRVRSRETEDVINEGRMLAENGCREIVLTGIHLSSYGTDLPEKTTLDDLIESLHDIEGITRIRLGSLEPGIVTREFANRLAALPKVCPHFHLSLQSGSTTVLKRMNRRYTAEEFEEKCAILREAFDRPAITSDVIVGFPGETEAEFEETVEFLKRVQLYETHVFKYSRRKGTKAAAMADQIPEQIKGIRSERLIRLGEANRSSYEKERAGEKTEVLFEEKNTINGTEYFTGYTKEYVRAAIPADHDYSNQEISGVLIPGPDPHIFLLDPS